MRNPRKRRSNEREDIIFWYREIMNDVLTRADMKTSTQIIQEIIPAVQ